MSNIFMRTIILSYEKKLSKLLRPNSIKLEYFWLEFILKFKILGKTKIDL